MRILGLIVCFTIALLCLSGVVPARGQSIEQKVLNTFFHSVIDAFTHNGNGDAAVVDPSKNYIQIGVRGIPLDPRSFNNIVSPGNINGSYSQAEYFAQLVNNLGPVRNLDAIYGALIQAAHSEVDFDPTKYAAYQRCWNILNVNQTTTDPITGDVTTDVVDSTAFLRYKEKLMLYSQAISDYWTVWLSYDLTNVNDQRKWLVAAPPLQANLALARDAFTAVKTVIEEALAGLNSLGASLSQTVISQAKNIYTETTLAPIIAGETDWHLTSPFPWNFASSHLSYNKFSVSSSQTNVQQSSSFSAWQESAGIDLGFFSVGESAGGSTTTSSYHSQATEITIKGEVALVQISRPWLLDNIFSIGGWSLPGFPAHSISTGAVGSQPSTELLPAYPTALIVVRNVTIGGTWTAVDSTYFHSQFSSSASVSLGPFALGGGGYQYQSTNAPFSVNYDNINMVVPGMQVLGWVNSVVPASPAVSGL